MAKRFKFRISLSSLQMCRSKDTSSTFHSPVPSSFMFAPVNHKAFDIQYSNFPDPPPSTPDQPLRSRSCSTYMSSVFKCDPPIGRLDTEDKSYSKLSNSPVSDDIDDVGSSKSGRSTKKERITIRKTKAGLNTSSSADHTDWFSSDKHSEETESLISSSSSFSSCDLGEQSFDGSRRKKNNVKVQGQKSYASGSWINGKERKVGTISENTFPVKKLPLEQLVPCLEDGKVNESYAVVMRSKAPSEDFKRSMMEMIVEKQMFEAKDLEQLLFCFLSLNSQQHHAAIVDAFTEVWHVLFPLSSKAYHVKGS